MFLLEKMIRERQQLLMQLNLFLELEAMILYK